MSTVAAKKLNEALAKAKNVGLVEETFILEDCELTLRNLRPDEYVAIIQACEGLDSIAYLHAYQAEHLARAIVGANGLDLHDVQFVEDEEPDPKNPEKTRIIKLELYAYLLKHVVSTWGKEFVYSAYRKFLDVVEQAERKAKEGVTFLLPEETEEEKYRRLLLEAKDCEENLPDSLIDHILEEIGLMRKTTAEEVKAVMERTDRIAREAEEKRQQEVSKEAPPPPAPVIQPGTRQPLNQATENPPPVDPHLSLQQVIASRKVQSAQGEPDVNSVAKTRAAQIAALELDAATTGINTAGQSEETVPVLKPETVELRKQEAIDPKKVSEILDRPPVSGINPRFRPQNKP